MKAVCGHVSGQSGEGLLKGWDGGQHHLGCLTLAFPILAIFQLSQFTP